MISIWDYIGFFLDALRGAPDHLVKEVIAVRDDALALWNSGHFDCKAPEELSKFQYDTKMAAARIVRKHLESCKEDLTSDWSMRAKNVFETREVVLDAHIAFVFSAMGGI